MRRNHDVRPTTAAVQTRSSDKREGSRNGKNRKYTTVQ